ncbi:HD-GYP domain-containing protein (c-di-GMP phosphodiesterase class II) [Ruminiclostridium sufflavum DSM 19573]|uniref:HD-GYP domain-containing protein (C-di-GMP phosphodiesterase class II) n=1 Tax=Ruminiclostridium sufflavum DSM 19573 TaxID=1121337 RepID=A0A318XI18_9FIRM|nr:HD domain-containing phosphohydrolase [Ruminiclostridium sufflavum]PYG86835.1 HD-GYP domain-containing protein (c-di-GMP phosphodiesterase class II) [Ruminiclostridium sufflavum DSM 19573]
MKFSKYYIYIIKCIALIITIPLLVYGYTKHYMILLIISLIVGLILFGFNIFEIVSIVKSEAKRKDRLKRIIRTKAIKVLENTRFLYAKKNALNAYALLSQKQDELEILRITSEKFNSIMDVDNIVEYIFDIYKRFTNCDRCLICFKDIKTQDIYCKYEFGDILFGEVGKFFDDDSVITKCFNTNSVVANYSIFINKRGIYGDKVAIPLSISNEQLGVIFLETAMKNTFNGINLPFLKSLSNYAAVAINKAELFNDVWAQKQEIEALYEETAAVNDDLNYNLENLNKAKEELKLKNEELLKYSESLNTGYIQTVMSLVNAIEAKDAYTSGHCQRVMEISCEIAANMNLDEDSIQDLKYAAVLHDIGKIGISARILNKTDKLTEQEYEEIKKHPQISYNILKNVEFLNNGLRAILEHHEKYNGSGYPNSLKGEEISLLGRILCVADAFDAMTSNRTYRKGMTMEVAVNEIERCKGIQFDPKVSDVFIKMIRELVNT